MAPLDDHLIRIRVEVSENATRAFTALAAKLEAMRIATKRFSDQHLVTGRRIDQVTKSVGALTTKLLQLPWDAVAKGANFAFNAGFLSRIGLITTALFALVAAGQNAAIVLGGALVAAVGQAIPVFGLLAAAFQRVALAAKAAAAVTQEHTQATQQATQIAHDAAAAQYNIAQAHLAVADAQKNLTNTRREATRALQDLVTAEKQARQQVDEADFSLTRANQNLRRARRTGSLNDIFEAEFSSQDARSGARQSQVNAARSADDLQRALRKGVEGSDQVIAARRALASATHQLSEAQYAAAQSTLALTAASRNAFALLDPEERKLAESFLKLRETIKKNFRPITDEIVRPIRLAVDDLSKLLSDPKVLSALQGLAKAVGNSIGRISDFLFSKRSRDSFILPVLQAATENLPKVTDILLKLARALADVGKAFNEALAGPRGRGGVRSGGLLDMFSGELDRFIAVIENQGRISSIIKDGLGQLSALGSLLGSVTALVESLVALFNAGGLQKGGGITGLADAIQQLANNINKHADDIRGFFGTMEAVAKTLATFLGRASDVFSKIKEILQAFGLGNGDATVIAAAAALASLKILNVFAKQIGVTIGEWAATTMKGAFGLGGKGGSGGAGPGGGGAGGASGGSGPKGGGGQGGGGDVNQKGGGPKFGGGGPEGGGGSKLPGKVFGAEGVFFDIAGTQAELDDPNSPIRKILDKARGKRNFTALGKKIEQVQTRFQQSLVLSLDGIAGGVLGALPTVGTEGANEHQGLKGVGDDVKKVSDDAKKATSDIGTATDNEDVHQAKIAAKFSDRSKKTIDTHVKTVQDGGVKVTTNQNTVWTDVQTIITAKTAAVKKAFDHFIQGLVSRAQQGGSQIASAGAAAVSAFNPPTGGGGGGGSGGTSGRGSVTSPFGPFGATGGKGGGDEENVPKGTPAAVKRAIAAANAIASKRYPYVWGGGHSNPPNPNSGRRHSWGGVFADGKLYEVGYDCSGTVSAVLDNAGLMSGGRVASGFMGFPFVPGPGKYITMHASNSHVWMDILGRAFGTGSNGYDGGAAWGNSSGGSPFHLPGYAGGAYFDGKYDGQDDIPIRVSSGEAILNPYHINKLGRSRVMQVLRETGSPIVKKGQAFASGALPGSGSPSTGQLPVTIIHLPGTGGGGGGATGPGYNAPGSNLRSLFFRASAFLHDATLSFLALATDAAHFRDLVHDINVKSKGAINKLRDALSNLQDTIDQTGDALQRIQAAAAAHLRNQLVRVSPRAGGGFNVVRTQSDIEQQEGQFVNDEADRVGLVAQRSLIQRTISIERAKETRIQRAIAKARRAHNLKLVATLKKELQLTKDAVAAATRSRDDNTGALADNAATLLTDQETIQSGRVDLINQQAQLRSSTIERRRRQLQAAGAIDTNPAALFDATAAIIKDQQRQLRIQLAAAAKSGNKNLVQSLTDQLAELDTALAENAANKLQAQIDLVNKVAQTTAANADIDKQLADLGITVDAQGNVTSRTPGNNPSRIAQAGALTEARGGLLTQRSGLQAALAAAQAAGNTADIQAIELQLKQNTLALENNTIALREVNNVMLQGFSSTAWQQFRVAVFNGLGGLLPGYQVPALATGGYITKTGLFQLHAGEAVLRPDQQNTTINVHTMSPDLDADWLGQRLAFEMKVGA